jgi:hypothetical protein
MSPGVRSFMMGFFAGIVACMVFITYYGDRGGDWLMEMGRKMKTVAQGDGGSGSSGRYETRHVQTY